MVDREVEEFLALCGSILSDGEVTEVEAYQLGDWLNHHEEASAHWLCNQLIEPLQAVWADGTANPQALQRLAEIMTGVQEEWAHRQQAMATYTQSLAPAAAIYTYVPKAPTIGAPLASAPSPPRERRSRWVLAAGLITILLVAAGLFAAREIKSAHTAPPVASSSPIVMASPVPSASPSLAPPRRAAVQPPPKPALPSSAWTVVTRQDVKVKAGKKEIVIPQGTTVKVIGRSDRDFMISYKGEDLTIPASSTTSPR
jgi:hypothetical protein